MDRKYSVFLSSTTEDLKEEREKAIETILRAECVPCTMEYFPATEQYRQEFLEKMVEHCDFVVLLVAGRYGSCPSWSAKSYTELEYDFAQKHNKPVIALLHKDIDKLEHGKVEKGQIQLKKLQEFRETLGQSRNSALWGDLGDLAGKLSQSLHTFKDNNAKNHYPQSGWMRATVENARFILNEPPLTPWRPDVQNFYFDCTEKRFIDDLVDANDIRILGVKNKNLISLLNKAFEIRMANKGENAKWNKITVVFLDRHLLEYLDTNEEPTKIQREWKETVNKLRRNLQLWSKKEDIRVYSRFFPFVGQLFDDRHLRIVHMLPGTDPNYQCYSNIIGNAMPCSYLKNNPLSNKCKMATASGDVPIAVETTRQTFDRIVRTSKSALTVNVTGNIDNHSIEPKFLFEQVIPNSDWSRVKFREDSGTGRIPVYVVVLVLIMHEGKIVLQMRSDYNSATVKGKYALLAGKIQDEDFFEDSGRDMEYSKQLDELMASYYDRFNTERSYGKFVSDMRCLSDSFASKVGITIGKELSDEMFEKASEKAVARTFREKLGCELLFAPFPKNQYPIEPYLEIEHPKINSTNEADYHRIYTNLFVSEIKYKDYVRIRDRIPGHHLELFELAEFDTLFHENEKKSFSETKLTPYILLNYNSLRRYVDDYQK